MRHDNGFLGGGYFVQRRILQPTLRLTGNILQIGGFQKIRPQCYRVSLNIMNGEAGNATALQIADFDKFHPAPLVKKAIVVVIKGNALCIANGAQIFLPMSPACQLPADMCDGKGHQNKQGNGGNGYLQPKRNGESENQGYGEHKPEAFVQPECPHIALPGKRIFIIQIRLKRLLLRAHGHSLNT